jgi:hypothetical protein
MQHKGEKRGRGRKETGRERSREGGREEQPNRATKDPAKRQQPKTTPKNQKPTQNPKNQTKPRKTTGKRGRKGERQERGKGGKKQHFTGSEAKGGHAPARNGPSPATVPAGQKAAGTVAGKSLYAQGRKRPKQLRGGTKLQV